MANKRGMGSPKFDKDRQREIAVLGGKAAHAKGVAHRWTKTTAKVAGRLGGLKSKRGRAKLPAVA
jgi:general stress protein YciG